MSDDALTQLNAALQRLTRPVVESVEWEPIPGLPDQVRRKDWKAGVWEHIKGMWVAGAPIGDDKGIGYDFGKKWGKVGFVTKEEAMKFADECIAEEESF